jgi:hypothetical protein
LNRIKKISDSILGAITDKDKERLGKIMAYGRDVDKWPSNQPQQVERNEEDYEEPDRFEECKK